MSQVPDFLSLVVSSDICAGYYQLCLEHPIRPDLPLVKAPAASVLAAAADRVQIKKLSGPGTVFQLQELPRHTSLNFILQGRGLVETDFSVQFAGESQRDTFAILCNAATVKAGNAIPNPPYPRPSYYSIEELICILEKFKVLVCKLAKVAYDGR